MKQQTNNREGSKRGGGNRPRSEPFMRYWRIQFGDRGLRPSTNQPSAIESLDQIGMRMLSSGSLWSRQAANKIADWVLW
jgi:hypothetical protein